MKYLIAILGIVFIGSFMSGCEERYRYPCQDPVNWETKECQKPFCSANGTCPEDLRHYLKDKKEPEQTPAPSAMKGNCK